MKTQKDQSITKVFFKIRSDPKLFQLAAAKTLFSKVYVIGMTTFNECFLFHVITGRHYVSQKFIVALRFL